MDHWGWSQRSWASSMALHGGVAQTGKHSGGCGGERSVGERRRRVRQLHERRGGGREQRRRQREAGFGGRRRHRRCRRAHHRLRHRGHEQHTIAEDGGHGANDCGDGHGYDTYDGYVIGSEKTNKCCGYGSGYRSGHGNGYMRGGARSPFHSSWAVGSTSLRCICIHRFLMSYSVVLWPSSSSPFASEEGAPELRRFGRIAADRRRRRHSVERELGQLRRRSLRQRRRAKAKRLHLSTTRSGGTFAFALLAYRQNLGEHACVSI